MLSKEMTQRRLETWESIYNLRQKRLDPQSHYDANLSNNCLKFHLTRKKSDLTWFPMKIKWPILEWNGKSPSWPSGLVWMTFESFKNYFTSHLLQLVRRL